MTRCLISIKGSEARLDYMEINHTAQNDSELDSVLVAEHRMAGKHRGTLDKTISFVSAMQNIANKTRVTKILIQNTPTNNFTEVSNA